MPAGAPSRARRHLIRARARARDLGLVRESAVERVYRRSKEADKELKDLVAATGTSLQDLHGIGPSGAARLLVDVADITRFPSKAHFASWNGTAPIDASSGDQVRHRLSRAGNRQINRVRDRAEAREQRVGTGRPVALEVRAGQPEGQEDHRGEG